MLKAVDLRTEYKTDPLGMDETAPRFFYRLEGEGRRQLSRRIEVVSESGGTVWDSGEVESAETVQLVYEGMPLEPHTRYRWAVSVRDGKGAAPCRSEAFFETGFLGAPWRARWIAGRTVSANRLPVQCFTRAFDAGEAAAARLYLSALGLYKAYLNGREVTADCFTPGGTDYYERVQYQAYDVAGLIRPGRNVIAVKVAEGWYAGRISRIWNGERPTWGDYPRLIAELHLTGPDGGKTVLGTDSGWHVQCRGHHFSDIYMGESYDATVENDSCLLSDSGRPVTEECPPVRLEWNAGAPVRRMEMRKPERIIRLPNGVRIVDFGRNLAGRERVRLRNPGPGAAVVIRHGEMLRPDGSLYTGNLRSAAATTVYITRGEKEEVFEPEFTFYGFRYLSVSGWPGELAEDDIEAAVIYSALPATGEFRCSNPLLNQLFNNIVWGQRGNFLDVPTDCPQRDERLGWTGDAQVFSNVATYNMYCPEFYTKWIRDLNSSRTGVFYPHFAPDPYRKTRGYHADRMASGWSDAGLICPWQMFRKYGDVRILKTCLGNMTDYLDGLVARANGSLIVDNACYGDWLNIDAPTGKKLISTAYLAGMNRLLAEMAGICGDGTLLRTRTRLADAVRDAFIRTFFSPEGKLKERTQTAALLALHFDLVPEHAYRETVRFLAEDIRDARSLHLSTGFLGTPLLLPVLSRIGEVDLAYDLLQQTGYPGWLYPVTQGATTMWERWNSWTPETGFGDEEMNSYNHYAYGAVGDWFYETVCGIQPAPTFRHFRLAPCFGRSLTGAAARYESILGPIESEWKREGEQIQWRFAVPPNTEADVMLPGREPETVGPGRHVRTVSGS